MTSLGYTGPYAHMDQQNLILYGALLCDHMSLQNDTKQIYITDIIWLYYWMPLLQHRRTRTTTLLSPGHDR